jgi:hypothetical protein
MNKCKISVAYILISLLCWYYYWQILFFPLDGQLDLFKASLMKENLVLCSLPQVMFMPIYVILLDISCWHLCKVVYIVYTYYMNWTHTLENLLVYGQAAYLLLNNF